MKLSKRFQHFFQDLLSLLRKPVFFWSDLLSVVSLLLTCLLPVWRIVPLRDVRPYIPLHYNVYFGVDQLGSWREIFFLPAVGLGFFLLNMILQVVVSKKEFILAIVIALATALIEITLLIAMVFIILLNLSYAA